MITSVTLVFDWKAEGPIAVTATPSSSEGIVTETAWPVYFLIMAVPSSWIV